TAVVFGEPEVAVWSGRDAQWPAAAGDAGAEFGDDAGGRNPADAVDGSLGEPEGAVRPRRNAQWLAAARQARPAPPRSGQHWAGSGLKAVPRSDEICVQSWRNLR